MFETLFADKPALFIPVAAIVGATLIFIVWIVAANCQQMRLQDLEAGLKRDMLERGMPAADIERVLMASSRRETEIAATETITDNEYYLVEKMLDDEHAIEDIERLVRAFKEGKPDSRPVTAIVTAVREGTPRQEASRALS